MTQPQATQGPAQCDATGRNDWTRGRVRCSLQADHAGPHAHAPTARHALAELRATAWPGEPTAEGFAQVIARIGCAS